MRLKASALVVQILFVILMMSLALPGGRFGAALAQDASLPEIEASFAAGDFEATARRVNELLIRDFELPPERRAAVYLMKARLELAFDRPAELRLWLTKAYQTDPSLALDPVKDPPKLIAVYDEIRGAPKRVGGKGDAANKETVALKEGDAFWVGLMPFGIGHFDADKPKDGGLFLSAELLSLLATATLPEPKSGGHRSHRFVFGTMTFAGIYGYELLDMTSVLASRDPASTSRLRYALSYFPFGVAQAKNREPLKAWSLAVSQAALLTTATLASEHHQRRSALGLFALSMAYGIYDGLTHHRDALASTFEERTGLAFQLAPIIQGKGSGIVTQMIWRH